MVEYTDLTEDEQMEYWQRVRAHADTMLQLLRGVPRGLRSAIDEETADTIDESLAARAEDLALAPPSVADVRSDTPQEAR